MVLGFWILLWLGLFTFGWAGVSRAEREACWCVPAKVWKSNLVGEGAHALENPTGESWTAF